MKLREVYKDYLEGSNPVRALDDINLEINRGDFITIMGPSGAGKSTLLHILGLLDNPTGGIYTIDDVDVTRLADKELSRIRNINFGFIFQHFYLIPELTALENVMLPMQYAGVKSAQSKRKAEELLEMMKLNHRISHYPSMMSGGEQQRVAIARALANDPGYLLGDEPTGNLPQAVGREILSILSDLHKNGMTVLLVTHDEYIGSLGKRQVRVVDGKLEETKICAGTR